MDGQPGLVEYVLVVVIELFVLLRRDLGLAARPQCRGGVEGLFLVALLEQDRQGDVVGIGLDDVAQAMRLEELVLALPQVENDRRAARFLLRRLDRELPLAVPAPAP